MIEIPVVAGQVLVVPDDLPGIGIESERTVRVEDVPSRRSPNAFQRGRGHGCSPEDQVQLRIVASHAPGPDVAPLLVRKVAPAVAAWLVRARDQSRAPELRSVIRIVGGDIADVRALARRAGAAVDDLAVRDDRSGREVALDRNLPDELPGAGIERNQMRLALREVEDFVLVDRDVPHARLAGGDGTAAVLPDEVAVARIQRLDHVPRIRQVHDPVVHERRRFLLARLHGARPGELQPRDVLPVDLAEGAVGPGVIRSAIHQPVTGWRALEHLRAHRSELLDRPLSERLQLDVPHVGIAERAYERHQRDQVVAADVGVGRHLEAAVAHEVGEIHIGEVIHHSRIGLVFRLRGQIARQGPFTAPAVPVAGSAVLPVELGTLLERRGGQDQRRDRGRNPLSRWRVDRNVFVFPVVFTGKQSDDKKASGKSMIEPHHSPSSGSAKATSVASSPKPVATTTNCRPRGER